MYEVCTYLAHFFRELKDWALKLCVPYTNIYLCRLIRHAVQLEIETQMEKQKMHCFNDMQNRLYTNILARIRKFGAVIPVHGKKSGKRVSVSRHTVALIKM